MLDSSPTSQELLEENAFLKRMIQKLEISQEQYRLAEETLKLGYVARYSLTGTMLYASGSMYYVTGYKPEEVIGTSVFDRVHPENRIQVQVALKEAIEKGVGTSIECQAICKGGSYKWIEIITKTIQNNETRQKELITLVHEITKKKQMEKVLRESEEKYRSLFQNASIGIFHSLPEGRFLQVNPALAKMMGYASQEDMISVVKDIRTQIYVDSKIYAGLLSTTLAAAGWVYAENRYRRKDGTILTANLAVRKILNADGTVDYLEGFVEDITERKRSGYQTTVLAEIGQIIASTLNVDEVYERFATKLREIVPLDRITLTLKNPDEDSFTIAYISGLDTPGRKPGDTLPLTGSIFEVLVRTRNGVCVCLESEEEIINRFPSAAPVTALRAGVKSIMAVPLIFRDKVIGGLHFHTIKKNAYTDRDLRLAEMVGQTIAGAIANAQIFSELKKTKDLLQNSDKKLRETLDDLEIKIKQRTIELEETNVALRVLLKEGNKEVKTLEDRLQSNVNQLIKPFLSKLKRSQSDQERMSYLNILESNMDDIVSPFINQLSSAYKSLTPKEIQVAELVKQGKSSKEIAGFLGIGIGTVITHRNNIRKKLDLTSTDANLRSHLLSLAK